MIHILVFVTPNLDILFEYDFERVYITNIFNTQRRGDTYRKLLPLQFPSVAKYHKRENHKRNGFRLQEQLKNRIVSLQRLKTSSNREKIKYFLLHATKNITVRWGCTVLKPAI